MAGNLIDSSLNHEMIKRRHLEDFSIFWGFVDKQTIIYWLTCLSKLKMSKINFPNVWIFAQKKGDKLFMIPSTVFWSKGNLLLRQIGCCNKFHTSFSNVVLYLYIAAKIAKSSVGFWVKISPRKTIIEQ